MRAIRKTALVAAVVALASSPRTAVAQTAAPTRVSPNRRTQTHAYTIHPIGDSAAVVLATATWVVPELFMSRLVVPSCPCSSAELIPLDRLVAGRRNDVVSRVADVGVGLAIALPFLFDALDVGRSRGSWREFFADAVVIAETFVISGALNQIAKVALRRPRPMLYDRPEGDALLSVSDNYLSFYSAHTSTAFAIGISYVYTFAQRHPNHPARYALGGAAVLVGGSIATMRVLSGRHFPTDVLVGALAGTLIGFAVPWLHTRRIPVTPLVYPSADGVVIGLAGVMN